ncbi:hypothetical protein RCH33_1532 [Flavobacterium daejeonense]|nr:hypothetical protein RCH33_1532 [Flavobacterium daejeonense]
MFQTKLSLKSIFYFFTPSIGLLIIGIIVAINGDYWFGIIFSIIAIIMFTFSTKKILLTENTLIIRKPLWIFQKDKIYLFEKIQKIKLKFEKTKLSGGPKLIVVERNAQEDYLIWLSKTELKEFVTEMEERKLEIEKDEYFENQLK